MSAAVYVAELASAGNNNGPIALHDAAALGGSPAVAIGADGGVGLMHGVGVLADGLPGVGVGLGLSLPLGMGLPMGMGSLLAVSAGGGLAGAGSGAVPGIAPMGMGMGSRARSGRRAGRGPVRRRGRRRIVQLRLLRGARGRLPRDLWSARHAGRPLQRAAAARGAARARDFLAST